MKKLASLLMLPLLLAGCDSKPVVETYVSACCSMQEKYGLMKLSVWEDKMVLNVKGEDVLLKDGNSDGKRQPSDMYWLDMTGVIPSTKEKISVSMHYDVQKGLLEVNSFSEGGVGYSMNTFYPIKLKGYVAPNETESCVRQIQNIVILEGDSDLYVQQECRMWASRESKALGVSEQPCYSSYTKIPVQDAILITENWNPENFKKYLLSDNDAVLDEHEKDACDVLKRLKAYIADKGYDKPKEKFADEIGCDTPVKVVELGTDQLSDNDYEYFVLNICENGRHTVARINWVYSFDRAMGKEELLPVQEVVRNGHTEYSTYDVAPYDWFAVTHFSDTDEYVVRLNGTEKVVPLEKLNGFQKHNYCAHQIYMKSRIAADGAVEVKDGKEYVTLTQQQALDISKNWDYNNMRLYHTGDQQHEKDACDVLERLDYFVRNLSKESQKAKNE